MLSWQAAERAATASGAADTLLLTGTFGSDVPHGPYPIGTAAGQGQQHQGVAGAGQTNRGRLEVGRRH